MNRAIGMQGKTWEAKVGPEKVKNLVSYFDLKLMKRFGYKCAPNRSETIKLWN